MSSKTLKINSDIIDETRKTQENYSKKVIKKNVLPKTVRKICGVDVSYNENLAFCSCVILDVKKMKIVERQTNIIETEHDYIPGYFMLREAKPIFETIKKLKSDFDILLIDANGRLHPRKCGLACYVGIKLKKPTIGIAKKLLCGNLRSDNKINFNQEIVGEAINLKNRKIFVSIGNMISLRTSVRIIKEITLPNKEYPQALLLADKFSKDLKRNFTK